MATSQGPQAWQRQFCRVQWKEQEGEEDRKRDGKITSRNGREWGLEIPWGQRRHGRVEGIVATSSVVRRRPPGLRDWDEMWPYFMVQWFCLISWRLFEVWMSLFAILNQYDLMFDLKIYVGHCDLYFMVHWLCITSWRLFDVWTSYFGIMGQYDRTLDLKINVDLYDLYYCLVILSYISKNIWCMSVIFSDNQTVWPKLWPQSKYKSVWPVFHGLVILLNIFKIIWWMNIIVVIMDQRDT